MGYSGSLSGSSVGAGVSCDMMGVGVALVLSPGETVPFGFGVPLHAVSDNIVIIASTAYTTF